MHCHTCICNGRVYTEAQRGTLLLREFGTAHLHDSGEGTPFTESRSVGDGV